MQNNAIQTKPEITKLEAWVDSNITPTRRQQIIENLNWKSYKFTSLIRLNRTWSLSEVKQFCDLTGFPVNKVNEYIPPVMIRNE